MRKNSENNEYGCGMEFRVNDNGAFYPAYMPKEDLQDLAWAFAKHIQGEIDYAEVKVAQIDDGKGLNWEIVEYSEDPHCKQVWLSRKHTFSLWPSWRVCGFHDHWLSGRTPRCEHMPAMEKDMQALVHQFLTGLATKYSTAELADLFSPQLDKHLRNRNWTNILSIGTRSFEEQNKRMKRFTKEIRAEAIHRKQSKLIKASAK